MIGRVFVVVVALASPAAADPLADAIAKGDIAALRAQLADPAARCALGVVFAHKADLSRAELYLANCDDAKLPAEIAAEVARAYRDVDKKAHASQLSILEVDGRPEGMIAEIDALPGERFTVPATLWIKAGTYEIRGAVDAASLDAKKGIANHVTTEPRSRSVVVLDTGTAKKSEPHAGIADFTDEPAERHDGPPPPIKHPPIVPPVLRGDAVVGLDGQEHAIGDKSQWIDEPSDVTPTPGYAPSQRVIVRGGVAVSRRADKSAAGIDLGIEHHLVAPWEPTGAMRPYELVSRVDWSERGYHVLGASVAAGKILAAPSAAQLGVNVGFHGQFRFDNTLDNMPMSRFGIDAAASVELALRDVPLDFGLRLEQGLNHIVAGSRERAVILEVGLEFRDFKK